MKNYAILSLLIFALLAMLIVGGCSKETPTDPGNEGEVTELDQPYGGFSTSDELPAFGDPVMTAEFEDDEAVTDPITLDPSFANAIDSTTVNAYFIRIAWGLLDFDSTATTSINWDGSATITRGTLGIVKRILFEPNDKIILPRPDRKTVEWASETSTHFDGIALVIIDRDTSNVEGLLTISTPLYSRTFSYSELDSMDIIETVTAEGHQVSIQAFNKKVVPFGGGFLEGRWVKTRKHGGIFQGRWINRTGTRAGHLKGIWGIDRTGKKVFFGKYITLNGQFGGLLSGNWGYVDNNETNGWFSGRWANRELTTIGVLKGHWKTKEGSFRNGFFHGKWLRNR